MFQTVWGYNIESSNHLDLTYLMVPLEVGTLVVLFKLIFSSSKSNFLREEKSLNF